MNEEALYVGQRRRTSEWGVWLYEIAEVQETAVGPIYRVVAIVPSLPPERAPNPTWLSAALVAHRFPVVVGGAPPLAGDSAGAPPVGAAGDLAAAETPEPLILDVDSTRAYLVSLAGRYFPGGQVPRNYTIAQDDRGYLKLVNGFPVLRERPYPGAHDGSRIVLVDRGYRDPGGYERFVTWGVDTEGHAFWGHYGSDWAEMVHDFTVRSSPPPTDEAPPIKWDWDGHSCPFCGWPSFHVVDHEWGGTSAWEGCECDRCGQEWTNTFVLTRALQRYGATWTLAITEEGRALVGPDGAALA